MSWLREINTAVSDTLKKIKIGNYDVGYSSLAIVGKQRYIFLFLESGTKY